MIEFLRRCEKNMLLSTIFTLVLGVVLAIEPSGSIKILTGIIAGLCVLIGVVQFVDYIKQSKIEKMMSVSLILGIIFISIGIFLFVNLESLVKFITVLIGLVLIVKSLFKIQYAFNIKNISTKWSYNLIAGLIYLVLGIVLLVNPFESAVLFLRIIGVLLAIGSIAEFIETNMVLHTLDDVKELPFEEKYKKHDRHDHEEVEIIVKEEE